MNKKLFVLTLAGLLLLSASACGGKDTESNTTSASTTTVKPNTDGTYAIEYTTETDVFGNVIRVPVSEGTVGETSTVTTKPSSGITDIAPTESIYEANPAWTAYTTPVTIYVGAKANIRNSTASNSTTLRTVEAGSTLTVDAYSTKWFRVKNTDNTYSYISKQAAIDKAVLDAFVAAPENETVKLTDATEYLNMRLLPSVDSKLMGTLKKGDTVARKSIGAEWSCIVYVDSNQVSHEYYVSNKYIQSTSATPVTPGVNPIG